MKPWRKADASGGVSVRTIVVMRANTASPPMKPVSAKTISSAGKTERKKK
jgi:hypothetical protein